MSERHTMKTTLTAGILAMATLTGAAGAQDTLLPGQIFDFQSTHPDFGLPAGSGGEVSGLVDLVLNGVNRPQFMGVSGLQLSDQALDADGEPIAPHLFSPFDPTGGPLVLENQPSRSGSGVFDTYDPGTGYDPGTAEAITGDVPTTSGIPNITAAYATPATARLRSITAGRPPRSRASARPRRAAARSARPAGCRPAGRYASRTMPD